MNDMSVKIEQLLKLQKGVCEQYEKENKELLKSLKHWSNHNGKAV